MDTLTSLRVFRDVVEAGSFAAAAQKADVSTAMASKHVAHLERLLGARLLNRTSRHLSLTEAGSVYLVQCRQALDALSAGEAAIGERLEAPRGVLKITAPVWCANRRFAEVLAAYRDRYPSVVVDIRLENRQVDLVEEGYDLALRVAREPSPSLIVRPICGVPFHLVASTAWLASRPPIDGVAGLAGREAILPTYVNLETLDLTGPAGPVSVRLTAVMKTDDTTLAHHAVHAGIGIALLPDWLVADDLRTGTLRPVLPDHAPLAGRLFAAYTSRKYMTAKVRSFIDFLHDALATG